MTEIFVSMEILSITDINEIEMTFTSKILLYLQWRDGRIKFKNLAADGTFLKKLWLDKIWLPPLIFSNTKEYALIPAQESISAKVLKQGFPLPIATSELNEGYTFNGDENDLSLFVHNHYTFECTFELSKFPFDIQNCSMDIRIQEEFRKYITLVPRILNYTGIY